MAKRLTDLDIMQGIAMTLVVLGHHLFDFMPEWYEKMFNYIYTFHMPLFIFISGFLVRYSYKRIQNREEYWKYIIKRAQKFALPYIIIGTIIALTTFKIDDINIFINNMINLFISPRQGAAIFLWYIHLLFIFYCIAPLIFNSNKYVKFFLFIFALLLSFIPIPIHLFNIDYFARYFIFFLLGAFIAKHYEYVYIIKKVKMFMLLVIFIIMSFAYFMEYKSFLLCYAMQWISIPAFYCITSFIMHWDAARNALVYVSMNCFGVYLLHMFFVKAGSIIIAIQPFNIPSHYYIIYLLVSTFISISATAYIWNKYLSKRMYSNKITISK